MNTFYTAFLDALRGASSYNQMDQAKPAAVLWTDKERQWEPLIPRLQADLPVLVLGDFNVTTRTGPAIWLRCMVDRMLPEADWPDTETPILYLPGVSKQELRDVVDVPKLLQPLVELQYRGVLWTQKNGKDWTIAAFLQSVDRGLNIEIGGDSATREAMQRALMNLADEPVEELRKDAPLTAARFNALLNPDQVRGLLLWMNDPAKQRAALSDAEWSAFRAECKQQYGFDPEAEGEITAATHLGSRQNGWNAVWNRYAEAPFRYPNLPELLRKARPAKPDSLFYIPASWPQENEAAETAVREQLPALDGKAPAEIRAALKELEKEHSERRSWVWGELGFSPMATALPSLLALSVATETVPVGATPHDVAAAYADGGWKGDAAVLEALAGVESTEDVVAVKAVVRALYQSWLESCAETFQQAVAAHGLPTPDPGGRQSQIDTRHPGLFALRGRSPLRCGPNARRRVKEQQKRIGSAEFRYTHFSYRMGEDGMEVFVSTPELHNAEGIGSDPLPPGQVWGFGPGGQEEGVGLYRIEVNAAPGSNVRITNIGAPGPLRESVQTAYQNLLSHKSQRKIIFSTPLFLW